MFWLLDIVWFFCYCLLGISNLFLEFFSFCFWVILIFGFLIIWLIIEFVLLFIDLLFVCGWICWFLFIFVCVLLFMIWLIFCIVVGKSRFFFGIMLRIICWGWFWIEVGFIFFIREGVIIECEGIDIEGVLFIIFVIKVVVIEYWGVCIWDLIFFWRLDGINLLKFDFVDSFGMRRFLDWGFVVGEVFFMIGDWRMFRFLVGVCMMVGCDVALGLGGWVVMVRMMVGWFIVCSILLSFGVVISLIMVFFEDVLGDFIFWGVREKILKYMNE